MLPIVLDNAKQKFVLIGAGDAFARRQTMLAASGCAVEENPRSIPPCAIVFIAGLDDVQSKAHYDAAKAVGALVNTEDVPPLCDFHMPAQVRRGDLLLTISTNGCAPGLSRLLREKLTAQFGAEWDGYVQSIAEARARWRDEGKTPAQVSAAVADYVEQEKWI